LQQKVLKRITEAWLSTAFHERRRPRRVIEKLRALEEGRDPREVVKADD
jgi:hypothetical protein